MDCCWRKKAAGFVVVVMALSLHARGADLPNNVRTDADAKKYAPDIEKYVKSQFDKIVNATDARTSGAAREELCRQPESPPNNALTISASFQSVYVTAVTANVNVLLAKDPAARINAGVILTRLAASTHSPQLEGKIVELLNDQSPAVALWGVKAAGALLPTILGQPFLASNEKLTAGIVSAAKKHVSSGAIIQEAYAALDVSANLKALPAPTVEKCVVATLAVMRARIGEWVKGVPPDPHAEGQAIKFVTREDVVTTSVKQKPAIAQHLMDLLFVTTRRAGMLPAAERQNVYGIASRAGGGMFVLMTIEKKPEVASAFNELANLPGVMSPNEIDKKAVTALGAARTVGTYQTLKNAPDVQQVAAD